MIPIPSPSVALNSSEFGPGDRYRLDRNFVVCRDDPPRFRDSIAAVAHWVLAGAPRSPMQVVINAHGMERPDGVALGEGLHETTLPRLAVWQGRVARIWLVACQMAATAGARHFCARLAAVTGAEVIAATADQRATVFDRRFEFGRGFLMPPGMIDDFEGVVWRFLPDGRSESGFLPGAPVGAVCRP
jgi:hypothetical protein